MRDFLSESLVEEGYRVDVAAGGRAGVERVRAGGVDLVVTDVKMPDMDGLDMLAEIRAHGATPNESGSPPHVVVITAFGSIETAKRALKLGAHDYITKPFEIDDLLVAVEKALDERTLRREVARLRKEVARPYRFENIIGKSPPMQDVFALIRRLSSSAVNVLITGESGTGKELVARALHFNSPRAKKPFVAVNCAAIPDTLLESELFGYKRGAFTDARTDRPGMFAEADGGTIFLDEIGDLTPALQAKLLRV
ncbi:MAG: sigma-54-dependent transcriptional regulator, partial [Polyangia bacterium]